MQSTFLSNSSFRDASFNQIHAKNTSTRGTGDEEFMKWMSSFNPKLLSKYPSFSKESQSKLRSLYTFNLQTDSVVDTIIKNAARCESEYEAMALKTCDQLQLLQFGDDEELSCDTLKSLGEKSDMIVQGNVGDGSDAGAVSTLAVDFLAQINTTRQKLDLLKAIKMLRKRNDRLRENSQYFGRELKLANKDVSSVQTLLENLNVDLDLSQSKFSKLNQTLSSGKAELSERGVTPAISNQAIMESHREYMNLLHEINILKENLNKYGELPCSITEASKVILSLKQHLDNLSHEVRKMLSSYYSR